MEAFERIPAVFNLLWTMVYLIYLIAGIVVALAMLFFITQFIEESARKRLKNKPLIRRAKVHQWYYDAFKDTTLDPSKPEKKRIDN